MISKRLIWADSLKGCLILLVVLGHAIQESLADECYTNHLWNIIYSFHMPAFMAVSGYLAFRSNAGGGRFIQLTQRRFRQLVVPFMFWTLLWLILTDNLSIKTIGVFLLYPDKGLWFLWVLFIINVLFYAGIEIAVKWKVNQELLISVICLLLCIVMVFFDIRILGFQFIAYYFIFYSMGYCLHKHEMLFVTKNKSLIIFLFLLWAVMAWFWQMQELPAFLSFSGISHTLILYAYRFVAAAAAIYVLLTVSPRLLNNSTGMNVTFEKLGKFSLGIYATHMLLMEKIVSMFRLKGLSIDWTIIYAFITATAISYIVIWVLKKWSVTNRLMLGKI